MANSTFVILKDRNGGALHVASRAIDAVEERGFLRNPDFGEKSQPIINLRGGQRLAIHPDSIGEAVKAMTHGSSS